MSVLQWLWVFCSRCQIDRDRSCQVVKKYGTRIVQSANKKHMLFKSCKITNEQFVNKKMIKKQKSNSLASCCFLPTGHWYTRQEKKIIV